MEKHIEETLRFMSKKMGISNFSINDHGTIHLSIENIGELFIDVQAPGIFLYILHAFEIMSFRIMTTALTFCEYKANHQFVTNPVLKDDDQLGFAIKIKTEDFTPSTIEDAINQLIDLISRLKQFADHL